MDIHPWALVTQSLPCSSDGAAPDSLVNNQQNMKTSALRLFTAFRGLIPTKEWCNWDLQRLNRSLILNIGMGGVYQVSILLQQSC